MARKPLSGIQKALGERLASTWVLLSDTTNFLSRTNDFAAYQPELLRMRSRLQGSQKSSETEREVRAQVVELRKSLRLQGFDLTLGKVELVVAGFRNDAAVAQGFRRLVVAVGPRTARWIEGEANHVELDRRLDEVLSRERRRPHEETERHFLWYRSDPRAFLVSGSDSEDPEAFERLRAWASDGNNALRFLAALKDLL